MMCPLVAGGTVVIAGEPGAGVTVVMEELVRRLSGGNAPVSLFLLMPPPSAQWPASMKEGFTLTGALQEEGYSEGTVGAVRPSFLRGQEEPWTVNRLSALNPADAVVHLSSEVEKPAFTRRQIREHAARAFWRTIASAWSTQPWHGA